MVITHDSAGRKRVTISIVTPHAGPGPVTGDAALLARLPPLHIWKKITCDWLIIHCPMALAPDQIYPENLVYKKKRYPIHEQSHPSRSPMLVTS